MKRPFGALAPALVLLVAAPAFAATPFVQDGAGMFSADAISQTDRRLSNFNAQTHKEVVVITVPQLPAGQTVQQAADAAFAAQSIDGVLIYVARDDRKIFVLPDRAGTNAGWFTPTSSSALANQMGAQFKADRPDDALATGVGGILDVYRSHLSSLGGSTASRSSSGSSGDATFGGFHFNVLWIIVVIVGFFILRSLFRPRYYGPPQGGPVPGPGGPGMPMGGYGYGGGGGFWSGLLGGLGGAWLGNEMFRGGGGAGGFSGGGGAGDAGAGGSTDGGGWTSDAGQAGDSGGGGADWGGGGWGGGGGGDFGGGGGDSGGGGGGGW